ncbi:hypothetical protein THIAE_09690 [Thiomicrospira aerophila AL3]|uniref:TnsE C-terminal domain-containing protein n=1 Tax=Thiomicrospira aerophila AL3 TaxID=717772 RepID=W0DZI0_9GAMM|nr:hypothetical protein [Thiomicrospira aerophila]AHF02399.1 hypothetical protein THIAE_09690 [Thiomicrospira aerophila AL3]
MAKTFHIETLFSDNIERVVRAFCSVKQNTSDRSNPLVTIAFRRVSCGQIEYSTAAISELDVLRIGSVWRGSFGIQNELKDNKVLQNGWLEFDLSSQQVEFFDLYQLINIYPADQEIGKTRVAKLLTTTGKVVYVQSLEIFTSLYTPENKNIRRALLNFDLDGVVDNFVPKDQQGMINGQYILPKGFERSNAVFLAYIANHHVTRQRLSKIRSQINRGRRFIDAIPYHPNKLSFEAAYEENNGVIFVHRINKFRTPTDIPLVQVKEEITSKPNKPNVGRKPNSKITEHDEIYVQNSIPPGVGSNTQYIESGVVVHDSNIVTETVVERKEPIPAPRDKDANEPEQFSSGSEFSDNDKIGKLKTAKASDKKASGIEKEFIESLEILKASDEKMKGYAVLGCNDSIYEMEPGAFFGISFTRDGDKDEGKILWHQMTRKKIKNVFPPEYAITYRKIALIKVKYDGKQFYFVEIQPRTVSDKYRGLMFSSPKGLLECDLVYNLMKCIKDEQGLLLKAKNSLEDHLGQVKVFKHPKNLAQKLKNLMSSGFS